MSLLLTHFCVAILFGAGCLANAATLPAGTELLVRLTSDVSSKQPSGQAVSAVLISPLLVNGKRIVSQGAVLDGKTSDATPFRAASGQTAAQNASLRINFATIRDQAGHSQPLICILTALDNAREKVDSTGLVLGIDPSQTYEAQLDRAIGKVQSRSSGLGQLLSAVESSIVKQVDADIDYKSGVEMTLKLTQALVWDAAPTVDSPPAVVPPSGVAALANSEPFRTVAQNPPQPSDMTNLMLIGTEQQIQTAFQSAGWFSAAALSRSSKMETARALIEDRGYSEAPMSILYLQERPPDIALQKQNNTFAMRHHIRIWQMPQKFNGKPVWVAAATHDIEITFSPASRSFTHGIDPNIDLERAKVVNDLVFAGGIRGLSLVSRADIPKNATNATGDSLITDGKMAVLEFQ